jgi:hypothetical protein
MFLAICLTIATIQAICIYLLSGNLKKSREIAHLLRNKIRDMESATTGKLPEHRN